MDADTATKVDGRGACPDGPTYQIQRGKLDGEVSMLFSRRTYAYLETRLRELKRQETDAWRRA
ncbi:MAG: hypothetical protein IPK85_02805 [Gemmatimonadetes bacterium]|nr:hypothetical protein [Gemmatimonadota bacterium]